MEATIRCTCPPRANGEPRHADDIVSLRERLPFRDAISIRKAIEIVKLEDPGAGSAEILAVMSEQYLLAGIDGWSRVDAKGKPLDVTKTAIRAFLEEVDPDDAMTLTDAADELYAAVVLLPLLARASRQSPPTSTDESTSPTRGSGSQDQTEHSNGSKPPRSQKPPKRSSTSASRTADTGTITRLPVGDSNSSPRLASAR